MRGKKISFLKRRNEERESFHRLYLSTDTVPVHFNFISPLGPHYLPPPSIGEEGIKGVRIPRISPPPPLPTDNRSDTN